MLAPIPFAFDKFIASVRHRGFAAAWQFLAMRRPVTFLPVSDFMFGSRQAFDFLNEKLSAEKAALQSVTSGELWEMIKEMPTAEDAAKPAFIETSAFISGLALPDSLPLASQDDRKQVPQYYEQSDEEPTSESLSATEAKKLAVKVKFFSLVVSGKSSIPSRRVDELELETVWDSSNGLGEWKIAAIN